MSKNQTNQKGFTLIELLVVIAIIGLLSSITMASLNRARIKARDTGRTISLKQLQTAIEMFMVDNGFYPSTGSTPGTGGGLWACFTCTGGKDRVLTNPNTGANLGTFTNVLSPYISQLIDPQEGLWVTYPYRGFIYASDGSKYKILSNRIPENLLDFPISMLDPIRCGGIDPATGLCNTGTATVASPGVQSVGLWSDDTAKLW